MTEDKKPFSVKDRRHFTAEGETRGESPEAAATDTTTETRPEPKSERGRPDPAHRPTLDFAGLLLSLGAQASLLLGLGDEEEPGAAPDLQGAQAIISLLEVLRDKTEGRRTPDEDRILEGILYELRMAYVAGTRAGGA
jgi:hypothetical protein